jgi:norsolorinic acid ketoreductase
MNALLSALPTGAPKFIYISSSTGSIRRYMNMSASASCSSKTAANFLIKALDVENPSLITLTISPGWLATHMGNDGAARNGPGSIQQVPGKVEDGVTGILSRIDGATKKRVMVTSLQRWKSLGH